MTTRRWMAGLLATVTVAAVTGVGGPRAQAQIPPVPNIPDAPDFITVPPAESSLPANAPHADVAGMPSGLPPAATLVEPTLPTPAGWNFSDVFSHTEGTGRLAQGALLWTDFLYDDHGAFGVEGHQDASVGNPPDGTYQYPPGPAAGNGADIFRVGIGRDVDGSTWWRVDWNTLIDPKVPIAEFALDEDANPATGVAAWPAGAGVRSPGIDHAIVVSGTGAWLVDAASGTRVALPERRVDTAARSFLVHVPANLLRADGTWTVRLAAGLADASGGGFRAVGADLGALPGEPPVYNVSFRRADQERPGLENSQLEGQQAAALAQGDVSAFSTAVRWSDLAARVTTPEPLVHGYSNRWYVSSVELGQGVRAGSKALVDFKANYLGRVQPYGIFVPSGYDGSRAVPLTLVLHSFTQNQNEYGAFTPKFLQQACERRGSICITPLGRGPDGFYRNEALLDVWEVWNRVARAYRLDPERTVVSGYSMGSFGTNQLATEYPQLFSRGVALAGAIRDVPVLDSLRWVPLMLVVGAADELEPADRAIDEAAGLRARAYRYRFELYPAEDHIVFLLQDGFSSAAAFMGHDARVTDPGHVTLRWYPALERPQLGLVSAGAYWVTALSARSRTTGSLASIDAVSEARPDPAVTPVLHSGAAVPGDPSPAVADEQTWSVGAAPAAAPHAHITVQDVASTTIDLSRASLRDWPHVTIDVDSDGPLVVTLAAGRPRTPAFLDGSPAGYIGTAGSLAVAVPAGHHRIDLGADAGGIPGAASGRVRNLPATGTSPAWPALELLALLAAASAAALRSRLV